MAFAVGAQVQLELALPSGTETAVGQVFAYDASTDRVVLRQPGSTPFHSILRVLKGADVTGVVQIKPAPTGGAGPLPAVDLSRCREREEKAVRAAEAEAAKIGVGVGRAAQVSRWPCMRSFTPRGPYQGHMWVDNCLWACRCQFTGVDWGCPALVESFSSARANAYVTRGEAAAQLHVEGSIAASSAR